MHGRIKVRTSAEMEAINKKRDQEKAAVYESKMKSLLQKKKNRVYDEELMSLAADVLCMNPDVATVWNARKECLLELKTNGAGDSQTVIDTELKLTEAGLRINPKSYCAWYHRCWVLENFADESHWSRELQICTKYLELDDRNFHCWDYRRYVVERLGTELEKELDYSLLKLISNFSNYSAWHYRSKLIPRVHSVFERENLFENEIYQQEVSMVESAVYTDPNDQSAWFYHRWLLGHISGPSQFIQAGYCEYSGRAWVVIYPKQPAMVVKGVGDSEWEFLNGNKVSNVLVKNVDPNSLGEIQLLNENGVIDSITLKNNSVVARIPDFKPPLNSKEILSLQLQLESYQKLLELEPDNKWTLLAVIIIKEKLGEEVEPYLLEKLELIDPYRRNYYSDLRSRHLMERALSTVDRWNSCFSLCKRGLTAFYHCHYFTLFEEVDFSENPLGNDVIRKLDVLLSCKRLNLANCKLTSIDAFPYLPKLCYLDISMNKIRCQTVPSELLKCKTLEILDIKGTCISVDIFHSVTGELPNLEVKHS